MFRDAESSAMKSDAATEQYRVSMGAAELALQHVTTKTPRLHSSAVTRSHTNCFVRCNGPSEGSSGEHPMHKVARKI